jgi:hypothetical protein
MRRCTHGARAAPRGSCAAQHPRGGEDRASGPVRLGRRSVDAGGPSQQIADDWNRTARFMCYHLMHLTFQIFRRLVIAQRRGGAGAAPGDVSILFYVTVASAVVSIVVQGSCNRSFGTIRHNEASMCGREEVSLNFDAIRGPS